MWKYKAGYARPMLTLKSGCAWLMWMGCSPWLQTWPDVPILGTWATGLRFEGCLTTRKSDGDLISDFLSSVGNGILTQCWGSFDCVSRHPIKSGNVRMAAKRSFRGDLESNRFPNKLGTEFPSEFVTFPTDFQKPHSFRRRCRRIFDFSPSV